MSNQVRFEHGWAMEINEEPESEGLFFFPHIQLNPPSWVDSVYDNEDIYEIDLYVLTNKYIDDGHTVKRDFAEAIAELQELAKEYLLKLFDTKNQVEIYNEAVLREASKPQIRPNEDITNKGDYSISIKFKIGVPKSQC